jgi:hypothetical protein
LNARWSRQPSHPRCATDATASALKPPDHPIQSLRSDSAPMCQERPPESRRNKRPSPPDYAFSR